MCQRKGLSMMIDLQRMKDISELSRKNENVENLQNNARGNTMFLCLLLLFSIQALCIDAEDDCGFSRKFQDSPLPFFLFNSCRKELWFCTALLPMISRIILPFSIAPSKMCNTDGSVILIWLPLRFRHWQKVYFWIWIKRREWMPGICLKYSYGQYPYKFYRCVPGRAGQRVPGAHRHRLRIVYWSKSHKSHPFQYQSACLSRLRTPNTGDKCPHTFVCHG